MAKSFKGRPRAQRALLVAAGKAERNAIMTYCNAFDHISLQGNHGDPNCRVGVDITNMFEIESDAYDLVIASDVLDYIPDLGASFREIKRVLKPNGKLFAYIQPWRILPGDMPPTIVHYNALAHEQYAATDGAQTGVPDCRFGIDWLASTARRAGLQFEQVQELDPIGELSFSWFVCEAV